MEKTIQIDYQDSDRSRNEQELAEILSAVALMASLELLSVRASSWMLGVEEYV